MPRIKTTTPADGRQARKAQPVTHRQTAQAAYQQVVAAASNFSISDAHAEIWDIEPSKLAEIRTLLGIPAKGFLSLTLEEKTQMVAIAREHAWMKTDSLQQTQGGLVNALPGAPPHTPQPPYQLTTGTTLMHHTIASPSSASAPQPSNYSGSTHDISTEFWNIDASKLNELKGQVGVPSKEIPSLTIEEKTKMFNIARARGWLKNPQGGPMSSAAGPSNHAVPRLPRQLHTTQPQSRSTARGSTSTGDKGPSTDTSLPVYKCMQRSSTGTEPPPPMAPMIPTNSPQRLDMSVARQLSLMSGGMPRTMLMSPMGASPSGSMPNMASNPQMMQMSPHFHPGGPHATSPASVNHHPSGVNMNMAQFQYRQTMQALHRSGTTTDIVSGSQGSREPQIQPSALGGNTVLPMSGFVTARTLMAGPSNPTTSASPARNGGTHQGPQQPSQGEQLDGNASDSEEDLWSGLADFSDLEFNGFDLGGSSSWS